MSSDGLQNAPSPEQGDVISTDQGKNLFHESDGDRANEDFEITHSSRPKMSYESQTSPPIEDWEVLMNWDDGRNVAEPNIVQSHQTDDYLAPEAPASPYITSAPPSNYGISDSESDNSDLAELPLSHNVFGTSVPSAGFFTPSSAQTHNASYTLNSMRSAVSSFGTRQSFATARSSLASYVTASNSPRRRLVDLTQPTDKVNVGKKTTLGPNSHIIPRWKLRNLVDAIEGRLR